MGTRTKALMLKWSIKEGASNSTCSEEAHEIYALAEELEEKLAALEADARRYQMLRDFSSLQILLIVFDIEAGRDPDVELDKAVDDEIRKFKSSDPYEDAVLVANDDVSQEPGGK